MNKQQRIKAAKNTQRILNDGFYTTAMGGRVDLKQRIANCVSGTQYYPPGQFLSNYVKPHCQTNISVLKKTTLEAVANLASSSVNPVGVLNFASGKNPGGGFLRGTQAQEESLARASALYASLISSKAQSYYEMHHARKNPRYTDAMIWTPYCPIFADDNAELRSESPYIAHIITSAAPNYQGVVDSRKFSGSKEELRKEIHELFDARILKMLHIFAHHSVRRIILGAWGCGVFGNNPYMVARLFKKHLTKTYNGIFEHVIFAIPKGNSNFTIFQKEFA